jgi:hypothetical protein
MNGPVPQKRLSSALAYDSTTGYNLAEYKTIKVHVVTCFSGLDTSSADRSTLKSPE